MSMLWPEAVPSSESFDKFEIPGKRLYQEGKEKIGYFTGVAYKYLLCCHVIFFNLNKNTTCVQFLIL